MNAIAWCVLIMDASVRAMNPSRRNSFLVKNLYE
jgi:hypothetical protein